MFVELTSRSKTIFTFCNFRHPNYVFELKSKPAETTHKANGDRQVLLGGDSGQDSINHRNLQGICLLHSTISYASKCAVSKFIQE